MEKDSGWVWFIPMRWWLNLVLFWEEKADAKMQRMVQKGEWLELF